MKWLFHVVSYVIAADDDEDGAADESSSHLDTVINFQQDTTRTKVQKLDI